jgi:transcriptional regulator with XRE-family HTH domain
MGTFWGDLILSLRKEQKISQRRLSVGAKVNRSTLRRIEEGDGSGDIDTIERLLDYMGYQLEALSDLSQDERLKRQAKQTDDPNYKSKLAMQRLLGLNNLSN